MRSKKLQILSDIFGQYYKSKNEYLFKCPFCKHYKKKLSINLDLNVFKCWICDSKGKNIQHLIRKYGTKRTLREWQLLDKKIDMSSMEQIFNESVELEKNQRIKLPVEYVCLARKQLPSGAQQALDYLKIRDISEEDVRYFKIGFCDRGAYKNRIVIPSFNEEGYCNYFSARTYAGDWLKYKNPSISKNIIFNDLFIDWEKPIVLVEGAFDSINIENSIPLLGSTLNKKSKLFSKIIANSSCIYLALDHDALKKSFFIIKNLLEYGLDVYSIDTSQIEDIGSISKKKAKKLKENATLMTFESCLSMRCEIKTLET